MNNIKLNKSSYMISFFLLVCVKINEQIWIYVDLIIEIFKFKEWVNEVMTKNELLVTAEEDKTAT